MIRELTIKNYKSILDHTIELGRINVFIGENGCGKTNILEAVALAGAAVTNKLSVEELWNRGMRVARPSIMRSSFPGARSKEIVLRCGFDPSLPGEMYRTDLHLLPREGSRTDSQWILKEPNGPQLASEGPPEGYEKLQPALEVAQRIRAEGERPELVADLAQHLVTWLRALPSSAASVEQERLRETLDRVSLKGQIGDFAIYSANALALRGLQVVSRRTPLGIYGEALDLAISALEPAVWSDVLERAKCVSWLDDIVVDVADSLKYEGHKLSGSQSTLYFYDKHMRRKNNVFSAENVNEGILHILFHLVLFVSEGTPKVLGIDNIDTALNPQLCRDLMKQLAELAAKHGKQALITTHNPAILDGLNLHDDEQRLFVVSRNDEGHTVTKRIKVKPQPEGQKLKLSELWMRGHLGGIPRSF